MTRECPTQIEPLESREFFSATNLTNGAPPNPTLADPVTFTATVHVEPAKDVFIRSKPHVMPR